MKTKYDMMSKEEKKKLIEKYKKKNNSLYVKSRNMIILCYIGIVYSCGVFIYDFFIRKSIFSYTFDIVLLLFSLFCLIKVIKIRKDLLNDFIIKK